MKEKRKRKYFVNPCNLTVDHLKILFSVIKWSSFLFVSEFLFNRCFSAGITGLQFTRLFISWLTLYCTHVHRIKRVECMLRMHVCLHCVMCIIYILLFVYFLIDLVPVSSTVIPLYSHQLNSTDETKYHPLSLDEEEYRIAYMKLLLRKKHADVPDDPDTLITCNIQNINR